VVFVAVLIVRGDVDIAYLAFAGPVGVLIYVRHLPNIFNLIKGTERRLSVGRPSRATEARTRDT
jgi:hypothetical protein